MQISDQDLRTLVRDAIARHTGHAAPDAQPATPIHLSFSRFVALTPSPDGQCVIEPGVRCNHCGYCQSYGH